jgi:hypothetical protein
LYGIAGGSVEQVHRLERVDLVRAVTTRLSCAVSGPSVDAAGRRVARHAVVAAREVPRDPCAGRVERVVDAIVGNDRRVRLRLVPPVAVADPVRRVEVDEQPRLDQLAVEQKLFTITVPTGSTHFPSSAPRPDSRRVPPRSS